MNAVTKKFAASVLSATALMLSMGAGVASAHGYGFYGDWRTDAYCANDYLNGNPDQYRADGCVLMYGSFEDFGNFSPYVQLYRPAVQVQYVPTYRVQYRYEGFYKNDGRQTAFYPAHVSSPYSWQCVDGIVTSHQLRPCL